MPPRFLVNVGSPAWSGSAPPRAGSLGGKAKRQFGIVLLGLLGAMLGSAPACAQSNNVRITKLSDVVFGSVANLGVDAISSQSICVYAHSTSNGYQVTASGSGAGGSFVLTSGTSSLAYDVLWNETAGQNSGTQLNPNVTLTGQASAAIQQTCNTGPSTTASLILVLRALALSSARAGSYSGTLTLLVGPE
jgi:hypothetical protein